MFAYQFKWPIIYHFVHYEIHMLGNIEATDTSQMYLLFQELCSMIFSGISPYLDENS
jgi:hypothetical protein